MNHAFADISQALRRRHVWLTFGAQDVFDQHTRTTLGPLWLLVNFYLYWMTIYIVLGQYKQIENFGAYLALGLFVWSYMSEVISLSTSLFTREAALIKGTTLPYSSYVLQLFVQSVIRIVFSLVGCISILFFTLETITPLAMLSLTGLLVIVLTTPAVIMVFAITGAYAPDTSFLVTNILRIGFFLSPVFWLDAGGNVWRAALYFYNPFSHFIAIVRDPIWAGSFPATSMMICLAIGLAFWAGALCLLERNRNRIVYLV